MPNNTCDSATDGQPDLTDDQHLNKRIVFVRFLYFDLR